MKFQSRFNRREWLRDTAIAAGGSLVTSALPARAAAGEEAAPRLAGRLLKTLKFGMTKGDSMVERFRTAKAAGFDGIELGFPGNDVAETRAAIEASGLPVDGSVCGEHWTVRHTSPDAAERKRALENLLQAIRDTHAVGGHSVLLVTGMGEDGPEADIWRRSVDNIAKAIPLAAERGVQILIENVWNKFLYDHDGGSDQSADRYVRYVDDFHSPWIGMQFDIGNHWKYGSMGGWIRQLGHRVRKLDVKGFSRAENKFVAIGDADIDFPDVRRALAEINFHGWVAAEVAGGDGAYLAGVARQIDAAFGL